MTARGTTNSNVRGSSYTRRRRREWLIATYRADVDVIRAGLHPDDSCYADSTLGHPIGMCPACSEPTCRCYRCGALLTVDTVTVDRIVPGCQGGTYRRTNIRPACALCNSETGGSTRRSPRRRAQVLAEVTP